MCLCPRFTGHRRTKETCKDWDGARAAAAGNFAPQNYSAKNNRPRRLPRPSFKPYLTGCFPPKPPARLLIHSDHRSRREYQQEYGGNKREILLSLGVDHKRESAKRRLPRRLKSAIDLREAGQGLIPKRWRCHGPGCYFWRRSISTGRAGGSPSRRSRKRWSSSRERTLAYSSAA